MSKLEPFEAAADAVVAGDVATLRQLLDADPSLATARSSRSHGATLLHYSGANGVEDERQKTPPNAVAIADLLIEAGAEINATGDIFGGGPGSTPLVGLVTSRHPSEAGLMNDLVRAFARSGQNLNGIDDDGLPLALALQFRNVSAARTLAECGARVDNVATAAGLGWLELVQQLVRNVDPPEADPQALPQLVGGPVDSRRAVEYALLFAATAGETEIVRFLVSRGVDVNARLHHGLTPLHEAARGNHIDVVRLLVESGARADLREERHRSTPVGWAADGKHDDVVDYLLEHGQVDLFDLMQLKRPDAIRRQLDRRAEETGTKATGVPLWAVVAAGDVDMVRAMIEQGADPAATDPDGKTAIDWAIELKLDKVADLLRNGD